jgi:hypothetical protein
MVARIAPGPFFAVRAVFQPLVKVIRQLLNWLMSEVVFLIQPMLSLLAG